MPGKQRTLRRPELLESSPWRVMPWWWAIVAAFISMAAGVTAGALVWLVAGKSASLRIEAIKVGLSVTAGIGGAWALLLAFRRQMHSEAVAQDTTFDATQRRLTELYVKGVEQLGHGEAAVRLGGLYALERLAQDNPEYRQTVVDVVCAYLRMGRKMDITLSRDDLQVRAAAQDMLRRHSLDPELHVIPVQHWAEIRIDLRGAVLAEVDFISCRLYEVDFREAKFEGDAWFTQSTFTGPTRFTEASFRGGAYFSTSSLANEASFEKTNFHGVASFEYTDFDGGADFDEASFGQATSFSGSKSLYITLTNAVFTADAGFRDAQITWARFKGAEFTGPPPDFTGSTVDQPKHVDVWPFPWKPKILDETGKARMVRRRVSKRQEAVRGHPPKDVDAPEEPIV